MDQPHASSSTGWTNEPAQKTAQAQWPLAPPPPPPAPLAAGPSAKNGKTKEVVHPVKKACLACRARKTKCNGLEPCQHCTKKDIDCEYIASRRGGSKPKKDRVPKTPAAPPLPSSTTGPSTSSKLESDSEPETSGDEGRVSAPEALYQQLLGKSWDFRPPVKTPESLSPGSSIDLPTLGDEAAQAAVRRFESPEAILNAYYQEIYPYQPFLSPPSVVSPSVLLKTLAPPTSNSQSITSPLLLVILAALTLAPSLADSEPRSPLSKLARRMASAKFAREAERRIDLMSKEASRSSGGLVALELVQALTLLGLWEWAHNSSVTCMRMRQTQALQLAMDHGLHRSDATMRFRSEDEWQRDLRRRSWWMAFSSHLIGSVISGMSPTVPPYDPRVTAEYPESTVGPQVWSEQMEALKFAIYIRDFVDETDTATGGFLPSYQHPFFSPLPPFSTSSQAISQEDRDREFHRLDGLLTGMIRSIEDRIRVSPMPEAGHEALLAFNLRRSAMMCYSMTLINLHKKSAMQYEGGIGLFTNQLCGLPAISDTSAQGLQLDQMFASISSISPSASPEQPTASFPSRQGLPHNGGSLVGFDHFRSEAMQNWSSAVDVAPLASAAPNAHSAESTLSSGIASAVMGSAGPFTGLQSLANIRASVEVIARLEVLNQAVSLSQNGELTASSSMMPFCSCELVAAGYSLLLLALSLQASNTHLDHARKHEELSGIWASCWVLLRGLRAYGVAWQGIDAFADELQAALNASLALSGHPPRKWG